MKGYNQLETMIHSDPYCTYSHLRRGFVSISVISPNQTLLTTDDSTQRRRILLIIRSQWSILSFLSLPSFLFPMPEHQTFRLLCVGGFKPILNEKIIPVHSYLRLASSILQRKNILTKPPLNIALGYQELGIHNSCVFQRLNCQNQL